MKEKLLVVEEHFIQGFGGIPECTLLLAKSLEPQQVSVDVLSKEGLMRQISRLDVVPAPDDDFAEAKQMDLRSYDAVLFSGAWNPISVWMSIKARLAKLPISYAPKGNLSRIEFTRPRDLKKVPYLCLAEVIPLTLSKTIIFESTLESDCCVLPRWFVRDRGVVVPEPFRGPVDDPPKQKKGSVSGPTDAIRFGFLAEISPRKGLKELVEGFLLWSSLHESSRAQLLIAGEARPGSYSYVASIKETIGGHPQGDRIVWYGPLRGTARNAFYRDLDFFVCPSRFESFGLTPIEALWQGTPVLCNCTLGCLEFLPPSTAIGTFDLKPGGLVDSLEKACQNVELAKLAAASYRRNISAEFRGVELAERLRGTLFR